MKSYNFGVCFVCAVLIATFAWADMQTYRFGTKSIKLQKLDEHTYMKPNGKILYLKKSFFLRCDSPESLHRFQKERKLILLTCYNDRFCLLKYPQGFSLEQIASISQHYKDCTAYPNFRKSVQLR